MPEQSTVKKKNANIELLRLIAMVFVVTVHLLDKGHSLVDPINEPSASAYIAWLLESFTIMSISLFILISGYFLVKSSFKLGRLLEIVFAAVFYALGAFIVCVLVGETSLSGMSAYDLLDKIFPIHMNLYWFITSYVIIYMASPLINKAVLALSEKQLRYVIILLLIYESLFKSVLPVRLSTDKMGYSTFWLVIMYIIGAYIRVHGLKIFEKPKVAGLTYVICALLSFAENILIMFISDRFGHLKELRGISLEHNHVILLTEAVSLFCFFVYRKELSEGISRFVCAISPFSLGIYLVHENMSVRYKWPEWLGVTHLNELNPAMFLLKYVYAILVVSAIGLAIDFIRVHAVGLIRKLLKESKLTASMKRFDRAINGEE